jgi:hypothetical protein
MYGTPWLSAQRSCFVFDKVPGSSLIPETEVLRGFPKHLRPNSRIIPQNRPALAPSLSSPIHYSLIILSFDTTDSVNECINKIGMCLLQYL